MWTPDETGTPAESTQPPAPRRTPAVSGETAATPPAAAEQPRRRRSGPTVTSEPQSPPGHSADPQETSNPLADPPLPAGLRVAKAVSSGRHQRRARAAESDAETVTFLPAGAALAADIGPSGLDGVPASYDDGVEWLRSGVRRHWRAALIALTLGWTGIWLALWGAAIGAVVGLLFAVGVISSPFGNVLSQAGGGQAITIISVAAGLFFGAIGGLLYVLDLVLFTTPWQILVALVSGALIALVVTLFSAAFERLGLQLRGYRRLSRDEVRRIAPLVRDVAEGMDLDGLPRFAMAEVVLPNAWSHMRTIVITTGLLQTLDDGELRAVLAHELRHWRAGDSVGLHLVWAAALPLALTFDLGMLIAGKRSGETSGASGRFRGVLVILGWLIAWPAWVILRVGVAPAVGSVQRRYEYEADAAAGALGLAPSLITALRKMSAFERGRTGWEQALTATHPPTELRVEALQPSAPDDAQYQESELRGPTAEEIRRLLRALMPPYHGR